MARYIYDKTNHVEIPITGDPDPTNFVGTLAQWESLTQAEKNLYDSVDLVDDYYDVIDEIDGMKSALRRVRQDITENLANLARAISEQDLSKYGYAIGDYFTGESGYEYTIADMDTFYCGVSNNAAMDTHHITIVVNTKTTSKWGDSTDGGYAGSTLKTFLGDTVLTNIKSDFIELFGGSTGLEHLISHHILCSNALSSWTWVSDQYISALTEMQVYGGNIWSANGYQTGEAFKQLEVFRKYNPILLFGSGASIWLRNMQASGSVCIIDHRSDALFSTTITNLFKVVGLIAFH